MMIIGIVSVLGRNTANADFGLNQEDLVAQLKVPQCREHCMDKVCKFGKNSNEVIFKLLKKLKSQKI